jgi:hypothetical protein
MKRTVKIQIKTESFSFENGILTIELDCDEKIMLPPKQGIFNGFNWFSPISLGRVKDLMNEAFNSIVK